MGMPTKTTMKGGETMTQSERQEAIQQFISSEVYVCQSTLVEELFKQEIFSYDDIINVYRWFDANLLKPRICYRCNVEAECLDSETGECETCFKDNQEPQEIYEWWLISDWLEIKLKLHGQPVLSNEYGRWWGRTCTGQSIVLDRVIEDIYDELMN